MRSQRIRCDFRYVRARFTEFGGTFGAQGAKGCSEERTLNANVPFDAQTTYRGQVDVGALQGRSDAYLKELLVDTMQAEEPENDTIHRPCRRVRQAPPRWLAERLPTLSVIASGR